MITALFAVSCSKEETVVENPEPEMIEVKIGVGGAITSELMPFTKADGEETVLGIGVWSFSDDDGKYIPYAYGYFNNENIVVSLAKGNKYKFAVVSKTGSFIRELFGYRTYLDGGGSHGSLPWPENVDNLFHYGNTVLSGDAFNPFIAAELFYGETSEYFPEEGGSVSVILERVSYRLRLEVNNLTDGEVNVTMNYAGRNKSWELYPNAQIVNMFVMCQYGESYRNPNYYEEMDVVAELKADDIIIPLGSAKIKVMRNRMTKVVIDASLPSNESENGFNITYASKVMIDRPEDTYTISAVESGDTSITTGE